MEKIFLPDGIPIYSWCNFIEESALKQAFNIARLPFAFDHVALMPDCHSGFGMPIGGVLAARGYIVPNAVGVDIGCGMCAVQTNLSCVDVDSNLVKQFLGRISRMIPVGFEHHKKPHNWQGFDNAPDISIVQQEIDSARKQIGTLGGGNHFIEIQKGGDGLVWIMIHSGSRNFGYKIAAYYHKKALAWCEKNKRHLDDKDLAYFPLDFCEAIEYKKAMDFALLFAKANRELMKKWCKEIINELSGCGFGIEVDIHHNYAAVETHYGVELIVHRKGATSARSGQYGIIPGSMGTNSYIVKGLGNPNSFFSCSHGAGRLMGRNEANRQLSFEQVKAAMGNVLMAQWPKDRKKKIDLSEAPQAYKNIEDVMEAQKDLVEIIVKLQPLGVIKG